MLCFECVMFHMGSCLNIEKCCLGGGASLAEVGHGKLT